MVTRLRITTTKKTELVDITREIEAKVKAAKLKTGICHIYIPHTTAAVIINENVDPDVAKDIIYTLNRLIPLEDPGYCHLEGNSAGHIKAAIIGSSRSVIIEEGRLLLGRWQGIYLCEFDGPRQREVMVKISP